MVLEPVALPGRTGSWSVVVADGRVADVRPAQAPAERLVLPGFHDLHVHADRAFVRPPRPPRDLDDAIVMTEAIRAAATDELMQERAERLLAAAAAHGSVRVRSHADVDHVVEDRAVRAVLRAGETSADRLRMEVVAFASVETDPATADGERRLANAVEAGATHVGAVPWLYADPGASIDATLRLGRSLGVPVDVHLDETTDPSCFNLERLAESTIAQGLEGQVTAGHCCALAAVEPATAARAVAKVAAAGITIVALPAVNLYLQDRGGCPRARGLTLVRDLLAAGGRVRFGSDNVRDVFFPYGDADPLEAGYLAAIAAHVDDEDALLAGICDGRTRVEPGDPADLVVIEATSVADALARRPGSRTVLRSQVPTGRAGRDTSVTTSDAVTEV